jgi:hypothetical protein
MNPSAKVGSAAIAFSLMIAMLPQESGQTTPAATAAQPPTKTEAKQNSKAQLIELRVRPGMP